MMSESRKTKISKFMSLVLRHKPDEIDLTLDAQGWVAVDSLLRGMASRGMQVTRSELDEVVATNEKKRFAYSEDGLRIRASQGHSVEVELGYQPAVPPEELFHGTADRNLEAIRRDGLKKMQRHHVHLSSDRETARAVGMRYGPPVILVVKAGEMHRAGIAFFRSDNGVWLVDAVAPEYIVER